MEQENMNETPGNSYELPNMYNEFVLNFLPGL